MITPNDLKRLMTLLPKSVMDKPIMLHQEGGGIRATRSIRIEDRNSIRECLVLTEEDWPIDEEVKQK